MKSAGWIVFAVAMVVGPIVASILLIGDSTGEVKGEIRGSGPLVGDFTFKPDACGSGQSDGFLGVFLGAVDRSDARVKVFKDPLYGEVVLLQVPDSCDGPRCKQVILKGESCAEFAVRIEKTNTTINDVRVLDGELHLECALASGDKISGDVRFEGCH
jgi:hypothetical protein